MADLLTNKVTLVTGAGRGIGRAIAIAMAGEGAKVAVTGRDTGRLEQVTGEIHQAGGQAAPWRMDVSSEAEVEDAVRKISDHWGQIPSGSGPEWTQPEDIARAALFLAAHAPADMTGQFINLFGANDHSGHAPGDV